MQIAEILVDYLISNKVSKVNPMIGIMFHSWCWKYSAMPTSCQTQDQISMLPITY